MLSTILNAFQVADIRKKIAFTGAMLLIYRLGSHVPVPGVNLTAVNNIQKAFGGAGILHGIVQDRSEVGGIGDERFPAQLFELHSFCVRQGVRFGKHDDQRL